MNPKPKTIKFCLLLGFLIISLGYGMLVVKGWYDENDNILNINAVTVALLFIFGLIGGILFSLLIKLAPRVRRARNGEERPMFGSQHMAWLFLLISLFVTCMGIGGGILVPFYGWDVIDYALFLFVPGCGLLTGSILILALMGTLRETLIRNK